MLCPFSWVRTHDTIPLTEKPPCLTEGTNQHGKQGNVAHAHPALLPRVRADAQGGAGRLVMHLERKVPPSFPEPHMRTFARALGTQDGS